MHPRYPKLCAAAILLFCTVVTLIPRIEARDKKGKASVSRSQRGTSQRKVVRNSRRNVRENNAAESDYAIVPDRIEVLEHGSSRSSDLDRWLNPPRPATSFSAAYSEPDLTAPAKRRGVSIDSTRVIQIQQALAQRGFYSGEMSGVYDDATIDAMRRFQAFNKVSATGYPTAQALKRLGLTNW